jgi:hypothetical protein
MHRLGFSVISTDHQTGYRRVGCVQPLPGDMFAPEGGSLRDSGKLLLWAAGIGVAYWVTEEEL